MQKVGIHIMCSQYNKPYFPHADHPVVLRGIRLRNIK